MAQNTCSCKSDPVQIVRETCGTPTAKLIAVLTAFGITDAAEMASLIGISERGVRKARNYRAGTTVPRGTTGPELQGRDGTTGPKTELQARNCGSALARAYKESLRDTSSLEVKNKIPQTPNGGFHDVPDHVQPVVSWSSAFEQPDSHAAVVRTETGAIQLVNGTRQFWLGEFENDAKRLDLALIEIAGEINIGSRKPLAADVQSRLARKAADKRDRDKRYRDAVRAKAQPAKPTRVSRW